MKRGRKAGVPEKSEGNTLSFVAGRHPLELHFARLIMRLAQPPDHKAGKGNPPIWSEPLDPDEPDVHFIAWLEQHHPNLARFPGLIPWESPLESLARAARRGDKALADFLENAAGIVRRGDHRKMFIDEMRLALRYIVGSYRGRTLPGENKLTQELSDALGYPASRSWVHRELVALKASLPPRSPPGRRRKRNLSNS